MKSHYWENRHSMTPEKSLVFLKEGNDRFLSNLRVNRNLLQLVDETAEKQFPFATILSCSDSRISPELIFDQGLGDIFSIRLAGNVASSNAIGSMEYACAELGSKLVVVLGHTCCGAVKAACDDISFGNLTQLLEQIRFSISLETETIADRNSRNKIFVNNVARLNVLRNMEIIVESSSILRDMLDRDEIDIIGAMYNVESGKVTFMEDDFMLPYEHLSFSHIHNGR